MKIGIGITAFSWPAGDIGPMVARLARSADEAGVDSLWVMDHFGGSGSAPW
jgi:alkanesulfonate monooxygenase SsuD/methylene tetrahydromethanopterin reductase-like flavin-dependent oxidoreductase (luciferase family)